MQEAHPIPSKLRVCHVATGDLWGGAEAQILSLLSYLNEEKQVLVSAVLFNHGKLADELRALGIDVTVISEAKFNAVRLLYELVRHFVRVHVDIVHAHKPKDTVLASLAARMAGISNIIGTIHGSPEPLKGWSHWKMAFYLFLDWLVNKYLVTVLVAVSDDLERRLRCKYDHRKIVSIHNGLDLRKVPVSANNLDLRKELGICEKSYVLGTVGRLVPIKAHEQLLHLASTLLAKGWKFTILIVGEGPERKMLETLSVQMGLSQHVILLGHQARVHDYLHLMDVFVLTSLHEGIPIALLEALALKKPVVVTRVGGIPEVVEHGKSGLLIPPNDIQELVTSTMAVLTDRNMARYLGENGRRKIEEQFSVSQMSREMTQLYRKIALAEHQ
jgi:glycosyltransferase involved in cell wall biosynthesis